jgi:hypothetical protein
VGAEPFADNAPGAITEEQAEAIQRWCEDASARLGLRDWRWRVSTHEAEPKAYASSYVLDQGDESVVAVSSDFTSRPEPEQRHSLTHEVLHPHFYRVTRLFDKLIERELGNRTEAVIMAAVHEAEEQAIDRMAYAVARMLPPLELPE